MADNRTNARPYFVRVSYPRTLSPPAVPTLLSPANNAVNQPLTSTLSWTGNGEGYRVQVSTNSGFTNIIVDQSIMLNTSYQIPAPILTQSTTYYWRVSATSPGGTSSFSSPFAFTTTSATLPAAPTLITPASGASNVSITPSFDWSDVSGAASYRFQLSTSNSFNTTIVDSLNVTQSQFNLPVSLLNSTTYYWRVAAKNTAGTGLYSSIFSFTTVLAPPVAPTLVAPPNGSNGISTTDLFLWQGISGATLYNFQIATDVNFNNLVHNVNVNTTLQIMTAGILQPNTLYFWRVRASNGSNNLVHNVNVNTTLQIMTAGILQPNTLYFWRVRASNGSTFGAFSATWNFRTMTSGITSLGGIIPTEFKLYNNYPNPFNPSTTIRFDIPKNTDVKIRVFDLTGKMVSELIDFSVPPGAYETSFNASILASGIYYYRFEAGEFIDTKKMMLIK